MAAPWAGRVLGIAAAAGVMIGVAALSQAPYRPYPGPDAMVRLAWSARPERIETCRRQTEEELAKWPPHMRQLVVCEGTSARYRIELLRDGARLLVDTVRGGGARHDRPLYVLREQALPPGPMRLEVRFTRIDHPSPQAEVLAGLDSGTAARLRQEQERREAAERERRREEAVPPALVLDTTVSLAPRTVLLVTYDRTRQALVARAGP